MNLSVFKPTKLPFLELRYLKQISQCQKMHLHDEITITAIKEGALNINLKDSSFTLKPNSAFIINAFVSHSATLDDICKGGYVLYLNKEYLELNNLYFNKAYTPLEDSDFINICDILLDEKVPIMQKEELVLSFCIKVFDYEKEKEKEKNHLALNIKNYLDKNYLEELLLDDISKEFNITVTHLIRVFKKEFELTIHSYILNKKVHKAKQLLSSQMPINEIALECGFFDLNHLNKNFKKVFQITPKQFQKSIRC